MLHPQLADRANLSATASPMLTGVNDDDAKYELLAVPCGGDGAPQRRIGRHRAYEGALRARDEDVLDQLAARDGWYTLIEHVIVGPGLQGPRTVPQHATALGVDTAADRLPNAEDLDDAAHWLATIHQT